MLIVGEIDRALDDPITPRLREARAARSTRRASTTTMSSDIRHDVWAKLIGNLSFNPVAALTYANMARICASEGLLDVIRAMLREAWRWRARTTSRSR